MVKYLKLLQTLTGLNQSEFAKKLKVKQSAISRYYKDGRNIKYKTLEQFADMLNISLKIVFSKSDMDIEDLIKRRLKSKHDYDYEGFIAISESLQLSEYELLEYCEDKSDITIAQFSTLCQELGMDLVVTPTKKKNI